MLFNVMKKLEKIVFYEFNTNFALIFHKWKIVLNNLTLQFAISNTFIYIRVAQKQHIFLFSVPRLNLCYL